MKQQLTVLSIFYVMMLGAAPTAFAAKGDRDLDLVMPPKDGDNGDAEKAKASDDDVADLFLLSDDFAEEDEGPAEGRTPVGAEASEGRTPIGVEPSEDVAGEEIKAVESSADDEEGAFAAPVTATPTVSKRSSGVDLKFMVPYLPYAGYGAGVIGVGAFVWGAVSRSAAQNYIDDVDPGDLRITSQVKAAELQELHNTAYERGSRLFVVGTVSLAVGVALVGAGMLLAEPDAPMQMPSVAPAIGGDAAGPSYSIVWRWDW